MAGGRRPASYVSGARHNTGIDRQQTVERPTSPTLSSLSGTSLPLWIPSIWQPQPTNTTQSKDTGATAPLPTRPANPNADPSSALAAALDSAVQSAVVRALGTPGSIPPASPQVTSTVSSETGVEDDSISGVVTSRERDLSELVEDLHVRLCQRDEDIKKLTERLDSMERKLDDAETTKRHQDTVITDLSKQLQRLTEVIAETNRKQDARIAALRDQSRIDQTVISNLRDEQSNLEAESGAISRATREIADDVSQIRGTMSSELERTWNKMAQLDRDMRTSVGKLEEKTAHDTSPSEFQLETVKRSVEATNENVASMRSRLKRVESLVADVCKQANDSIALRSGFEDSIKEGLDQIRASVAALRAETSRLRGNMSKSGSGSEDGELVSTRIDALEGSLKALKKLIESNLRTQWSAEGIVKEQVSLITKHVCVAMRQYTARRISENNALIDKALRARIPEYAKNDDQFVLVREEDLEGNGTVNIQKTSEPPPAKGS